jgi:hypothetical protein
MNLRAGMPPDEARRQAHLRRGGAAALAEAHHERRSLPVFESLLQDIRHAVRAIGRHRGLAAACIATLALGIAPSSTWSTGYC